tara:strand:+ start:108 stop:1037 length:930 start_codon:yes stop_codon:yes gene_type:complete
MKELIVFILAVVLFVSCKKDIEGCTDLTSINYNPDATIDNGSCQYLPELSTISVLTNGTTAESGGNITSDGGSGITSKGVCWGLTPNPTTENDTTNNGNGTGSFSSVINLLDSNTKYFLRAYATNSNGTGYGDELSFCITTIGATFQGGIVFYLDSNGGGLVAAPTDQSTVSATTDGAVWGCNGSDIMGADGIEIGTGNQNTIDIEVGCLTVGTAADVCSNLILGGFNDWFLPSKDELNLMWINLADTDGNGSSTGVTDPNNIGGFAYYTYWSSTEDDIENAWMQNFSTGNQRPLAKYSKYWVRAVRAF